MLSALQLLLDYDGSGRGPRKLAQLKDNSNYMRDGLVAMGCTVLGDHDSPVMVRAVPRSPKPLPLVPPTMSCTEP